jgi:hypothetical protein
MQGRNTAKRFDFTTCVRLKEKTLHVDLTRICVESTRGTVKEPRSVLNQHAMFFFSITRILFKSKCVWLKKTMTKNKKLINLV